LVRAGLPEPLVNPEVSTPGAERRLFGDLVYPDFRVIVEYDGEQHRTDPRQYAADVARLEALAVAGWFVVRVLAHDLRDPAALTGRIARVMHGRGWRPPRSELHLLR
jgi:very-short-patch-repair endonuclease